MVNEEQQEYRATGTEFKHEDTTQVMRIRFIAGNRFPIYPTEGHKFVAKIGDADGNYTGDYPVSVSGSSFEVKSSDLKGLDSGNYRLEVWESYVDSEGNTQTGIFPSPRAFVSFTINKNIEDTAWDLVKDISFQDLVNTAVTAAGQNIVVIATNTLPAGSQASVTQKYEDGKNKFTFNIPRGEQGVQGNSGKPFSIAKVFPSKDAMTGDGLSEGDFVMIASNVDDPNNATLFTWDGTSFKEIADLSGAQGIQGPAGPAPTLHVTKVATVPNGGQPSFTAIPVGNGNYNIEIGLPKGDKGDTGSRGYSFWAMKMTAGGNVSGRYITDLYNASATNLPEVNDLVVQPDGNVYSVTNVVKDTIPGAADGGATFDLGPALFSINGDQKDSSVNYVQYSGASVPDTYKDLNTFPANSEVLITDNIGNLKNIPSQLVGASYAAAISTESVGNNSSGTIQKLFVVDTNDIYERLVWGGENTYHPWLLLANGDFYKSGKMTGVKTGSPYDDLNTFPTGQTVTIAETPDKVKQIKNLPPISNTTGGLTVRTESSINDTIGGIQIAIDNNNVMYHRICWGASGRWGAWRSDSVDEHSNDVILPTLSLFQKVGVVGDSYASGELAFDGKYVDHYEISWLQTLARKDGFTGTNFSMGGMSTRTWLTNPKCMPLMQSSDAQDLYILALGINDEALGVSYIGSEADIDNGADTFYGNYGKIIKAIQAKAPQAKLVIATIADSSDLAAKFNEAITTIANHFTIPVIVQLDDPLFNSSFYKDNMIGGHPTGPVYSSMAEAFERLIGQSMIDHLDYYKTFKKDA